MPPRDAAIRCGWQIVGSAAVRPLYDQTLQRTWAGVGVLASRKSHGARPAAERRSVFAQAKHQVVPEIHIVRRGPVNGAVMTQVGSQR